MNDPKPVDVTNIKRRITQAEASQIAQVKLLPYEEKTKAFIEEVSDAFPFILLQYGKDSIDKINGWGLLPPPVPTLLKGLSWAIDYAARRYSVKQKKIGQ